MRKRVLYLASIVVLLALAISIVAVFFRFKQPLEEPITQPEYRIIVIYFYPNDVTPELSYLPAINEALKVVQEWYAEQLGGRTFQYDPVIVQEGSHELEWYINDEPQDFPIEKNKPQGSRAGGQLTILTKIMEDLRSLDYPVSEFPFLDVPENRVYLIFAHITTISYAWQGERVGLLGAHVPRALLTEIEWEINAACGTIAHELGHAFGLAECPCGPFHPDVMCAWGQFPNVGLCESSIEYLLNCPFFW